MLIGEFRHNLDPKGRVTIPSKFREDLSSFVMTKGLDDCLFLYPSDQWEKIENKLKELPMTNKAVRSFVRTFFLSTMKKKLYPMKSLLKKCRSWEYNGICTQKCSFR